MRLKKTLLILAMLPIFCSANSYAVDLMQVYTQAQKADPTYRQALGQYHADLEAWPIARSFVLPQVVGTAGIQYEKNNVSANKGAGIGASGAFSGRQTSAALSLNQVLFNYATLAGLSKSQLLVEAAHANFALSGQQLIIDTAQAYFNILEAQEILVQSQAQERFMKEQLRQEQAYYDVGKSTGTDLDSAKASYADSQSATLIANNDLDDAKNNLAAITGKHEDKFSRLSDSYPFVSLHPNKLSDWVDLSLKHNWALQAAKFNDEATKKDIAISKAGHMPTLNITGSIGKVKSSETVGDFGDLEASTQSIGITGKLPIYSGGSVMAKTRQARANSDGAGQIKEAALRNTKLNTHNQFYAVQSILSQLHADESALKYANSALEGAIIEFKAGSQTFNQVLDFEQNYFADLSVYTKDRYTYLIDVLNLKLTAGKLNASDLESINKNLVDKKIIDRYYPEVGSL